MRFDPTLIEMVTKDPESAAKLVHGIQRAVQRSYDSDLRRDSAGRVVATQSEIKGRINMCVDMAKLLRHEAKWSIDRISDRLPALLRRRLDGLDWDPTSEVARHSWAGVE